MSIRVIYSEQPNFPATDNHPDAHRLEFAHPTRGALYVDYTGAAPDLAAIDAFYGE